jgi:hypothetical protein
VDISSMSYDEIMELQERLGSVSQGASTQRIDQLPTSKYDSSSTNDNKSEGNSKKNDDSGDHQCSVCMEEFESGETIRTLPCFHKFHAPCIDTWLKQKAQCPICRADV